jgi:hypothetical protein
MQRESWRKACRVLDTHDGKVLCRLAMNVSAPVPWIIEAMSCAIHDLYSLPEGFVMQRRHSVPHLCLFGNRWRARCRGHCHDALSMVWSPK